MYIGSRFDWPPRPRRGVHSCHARPSLRYTNGAKSLHHQTFSIPHHHPRFHSGPSARQRHRFRRPLNTNIVFQLTAKPTQLAQRATSPIRQQRTQTNLAMVGPSSSAVMDYFAIWVAAASAKPTSPRATLEYGTPPNFILWNCIL